MLRTLVFRLTLGTTVLIGTSAGAGAQQLRELTVALERATAADRPAPPSAFAVTGSAMGFASVGAVGGGSLGGIVDQISCERRHGREQGALFGPCFAYVAGAAEVGWFSGSLVGATAGAARMARRRGCPTRSAWLRAAGGALLGIAPGIVATAGAGGKFPPQRSALIFGAPLLAGAGAAAAVMTCHGS